MPGNRTANTNAKRQEPTMPKDQRAGTGIMPGEWHVPPDAVPQDKRAYDVADLLTIMAALRTPGTGCPWDLEQDFSSIAPHTIEEAYEVADAIDRGNVADLADELGDLLLQVIYHAQLGREAGAFDFPAVTDTLARKLIRRHPHVFGDAVARAASDVNSIWDGVKAEEKSGAPEGGTQAPVGGLLDDVPRNMPALARAQKIGRRVARVHFDWPDEAGALAKLDEEVAELKEAVADHRTGATSSRAAMAEELGDVLFTLAQVARKIGVDAEECLRQANRKFEGRWGKMEKMAADSDKPIEPAAYGLEGLQALWVRAKRASDNCPSED